MKDGWEKEIGPALGFDPNFGGLDVSGCPSLQRLPSESEWIDERFAGLDCSAKGNGSAELKKFIADQTAEETTSVIHVGQHEFRVFFRDGAWNADGTVEGKHHRYTANDRDELLAKLMAIAQPATEPIRELSESERLQVVRLCQSGDRFSAIGTWLRFSIGDARAAQYDGPFEMMADASLLPIMDECCEFCWFHSTSEAVDTSDWHEFKEEALAGRPMTFDLLDAIWARYQDHLKNKSRSSLLRQFEEPELKPEPRDVQQALEEESDEGIQRLYKGAVRELADSYRRLR
jgi:hypothetical protein